MANPSDKTELQRLEEERDAVLACLAICEAARVTVNQTQQRMAEERQKGASKDDKSVISSLSELVGTSRSQQNRQSQTDTPGTGTEVDRGITSPPRPTNLACRQRETQPQTKELGGMGVYRESCGDSAEGSQGDPHEESFVMVEDLDEGDLDGDFDDM